MTCGGYSRRMTDLSRGMRARRGARRPGWLLLTALLVLAIGASSALVFTDRVELLKLAVILALWAAVVAAFVSVIYRRQSDIDEAKVRDLKLVYDLQLDREISARREYELTVETQLRRELTSEIRAQAADEVAGLRAELAALRANLEILFDADLSHRPALETDRSTARAYSDWPPSTESAGRVTASRIDTEDREDIEANTEESPIIDVPAEPHPPEADWVPQPSYGGAHRRPSEAEQEGLRHRVEEPPRAWSPPPAPPQPPPEPVSQHTSEPQFTWQPPQQERPAARTATAAAPRAGAARTATAAAPRAGAGRADAAPRARTGRADAAPRARTGRADAAGLAACARRGRVDTRGRTGQQLGVACRARFVGSADGRERVRGRICRQEAGTRAGDAVSARRPSPRAPLSRAGRRRSWPPAGATDVGRRIRGAPATPRARAATRTATCAAGGAATPQHGGHRRAVGCRAAGEASGHPDRRRPSQAPRRVS